MNIKTARALRDILSILIAHCKTRGLSELVRIKINRADNGDQYIIIRFQGELKESSD